MRTPKQISNELNKKGMVHLTPEESQMLNTTQENQSITCIPVGQEVTVGGSIKATVLQICIQSHNRVTYEVAWWAGNARSTAWVDAGEIEKHIGSRVRIGF